jgi:hypothetical protein
LNIGRARINPVCPISLTGTPNSMTILYSDTWEQEKCMTSIFLQIIQSV